MSAPQLMLSMFFALLSAAVLGGLFSAACLLWLLRRLGGKAFAAAVGGYLAAVADGGQR